MKRPGKLLLATIVAVVAAGGAGIVLAQSPDAEDAAEIERPITGSDLHQASEAALAHTGGGRVTDTEVGDEESLYEVEVTLPDGSQVDVQLDADFRVVSDERESAEDDD